MEKVIYAFKMKSLFSHLYKTILSQKESVAVFYSYLLTRKNEKRLQPTTHLLTRCNPTEKVNLLHYSFLNLIPTTATRKFRKQSARQPEERGSTFALRKFKHQTRLHAIVLNHLLSGSGELVLMKCVATTHSHAPSGS